MPAWQAPGASRDVVLLDIALDGYFRLLVERIEKSSLQGDDLCELVALVLRNALVTFDSIDFAQVVQLPMLTSPSELWAEHWPFQ